MEQNIKSYQLIIDKLKENNIKIIPNEDIQLFTDQLKDYYSVCVRYMSTGIRVLKKDINENELTDIPNIKLFKTWECQL